MSYPMPDFASMKGQELVDIYNMYATKPRQGKFHDNEQGRRVCEDLWRKWAAKNPPKGKEVAPEPTQAECDAAEVEAPAHCPPPMGVTIQEWDIPDSPAPAVAPEVQRRQNASKGGAAKKRRDAEIEPVKQSRTRKVVEDEVTEISEYKPRMGSKWATMAHKLQRQNGMTLSEGMEITGWSSASVVSSAIHRMATKMGKVITCEKRVGKDSLFRMEG